MATIRPTFWKRCQLTPRDRQNQQRVLIWLFFWVLSWVTANIIVKEGWASSTVSVAAVTLLSTALGIVMMLAYWKFVREADELQRKIQLDALAMGFGAGLVGGYTAHLLARAGFMASVELSELAAFMMVVYAVAAIAGERRYA